MMRARFELALGAGGGGEIISSESGTYTSEELPHALERVWSRGLVALDRRGLLETPAGVGYRLQRFELHLTVQPLPQEV